MELSLETRAFRMIRFDEKLWSFVPTGCGLIWAAGTLFDYSLYAEDCLLAEHVDGYYVDFDMGDGMLVYTQNGVDYQIDLGYAFLGRVQSVEFTGVELVNVASEGDGPQLTEDEILAHEAEGAEHSHDGLDDVDDAPINRAEEPGPAVDNTLPEQPEIDPADYLEDPEAPSAPAESEAAEPTESEPVEPAPVPTEPALTEPAPVPTEPTPTEPAPVPTEPAPTEPAPTEPLPVPVEPNPEPIEPEPTEPESAEPEATEPAADSSDDVSAPYDVNIPAELYLPTAKKPSGMEDYLRRQTSTDVENIVKRAHQMLDIRWTPRKNIRSWGGWFTYKAGVTYTGLPYCQAVTGTDGHGGNYIPWSISLTGFVDALNDVNSKMYTARNAYNRDGPYYGVDCSAFVSWALNLPKRCSTWSIDTYGTLKKSRIAAIQVGDFLNRADSHVVLVTDVAYNPDGSLAGIEISEATAWDTDTKMCCCRSTWFAGKSGLATLTEKYFGKGYKLYSRNCDRPVTYEHTCVVPLMGDECPICGTGMLLKPGVDVSQWQGVIDWQTLAPYIDFAIIRVGYRSEDGTLNYDTQYENNVLGCEANDIPYGLYFYSIAHNELEAMEEADFILAKLAEVGLYPQLPIFMDVEDTGVLSSLSNAELKATIRSFCDYLEQFGLRTGVYASESPWNGQLTDQYFKSKVSWVAKWTEEDGTVSPNSVASLEATTGANIWQYGKNYMPGIHGKDGKGGTVMVDVDYWLGEVGNYEHRYTSVLTPSTCTESGSLTYQCVDCDRSIAKELRPLGHDFLNGHCRRCGEVASLYDTFLDLRHDAWYEQYINYVLENGIFTGVEKYKFGPNVQMNRAMMVTVLWRMAGQPDPDSVPPFSDVSAKAYYAKAVTWAASTGIADGTGQGKFSPNESITREQAAAFLYRYAKYIAKKNVKAKADFSAFLDAGQVSSYAQKPLAWAISAGIMQGSRTKSGYLLNPKDGATRAEISKMLKCCIDWINPVVDD